jgi:hypothetical protein
VNIPKSMILEEGFKPFLDDYDGFPTEDGIYIFVDWLRTTMDDESTIHWRVTADESATTNEREAMDERATANELCSCHPSDQNRNDTHHHQTQKETDHPDWFCWLYSEVRAYFISDSLRAGSVRRRTYL